MVHLYCNNIFLGQKPPAGMERACHQYDRSSFPHYQCLSFSDAAKFFESSFHLIYSCIYMCLVLYTYIFKYVYMC